MNDLEVRVVQTPGKIEANFNEIKEALKVQMTAYAALEVTEDSLTERKADVATLRKIRTAVDDKRKEVKKTFDAPLKAFEAEVKEVTGILDTEINRIVKDMDVFEQKRIAEKQAHIQKLYDENIGEYAEYLPLSVVRSDKWNNKTCADKDIVFDISEKVTRVKSDIAAIKALGSEFEEKLLAAYKASGNNLTVAIQKDADYKEAKRAAEQALKEAQERKAREEAERDARRQEEARMAAEEEQRKIASEAQWKDEEQIPVADKFMNLPEPYITIRVCGEQNIIDLRGFLNFNEIEYDVIEEVC